MIKDDFDTRNFLYFLSRDGSKYEDSLIGGLIGPSSWDCVLSKIKKARKDDAYVRSINKLHLYVHVPFCSRLCTFCGCKKVLLKQRSDIDDFVASVTQQMSEHAPVYDGLFVPSLSFGGGTPSILSEEQLTTLLDGVDKAFPVKKRTINFEISPASWNEEKMDLLMKRGLARLSIGIQSMDQNVLRKVERAQTNEKVLWCLRSARKAGVPNVNVDLIAGLPGQTIEGFIDDVKTIMDEGVNVIHVQPLTGETIQQLCDRNESIPQYFARRDTMMREAIALLRTAGYRFKRPDGYAKYVEGKDYLEESYMRNEAAVAAFGPFALGQFPGAVFYQTVAGQSMADLSVVHSVEEDYNYVMSHYAMLEILNGLSEQAFFERFGVTLDHHCGEGLRYLKNLGLVDVKDGIWQYSGEWKFQRICEYFSLLRILYGEELLARLRIHHRDRYKPKHDYSKGVSQLNSYANNPITALYYHRRDEGSRIWEEFKV